MNRNERNRDRKPIREEISMGGCGNHGNGGVDPRLTLSSKELNKLNLKGEARIGSSAPSSLGVMAGLVALACWLAPAFSSHLTLAKASEGENSPLQKISEFETIKMSPMVISESLGKGLFWMESEDESQFNFADCNLEGLGPITLRMRPSKDCQILTPLHWLPQNEETVGRFNDEYGMRIVDINKRGKLLDNVSIGLLAAAGGYAFHLKYGNTVSQKVGQGMARAANSRYIQAILGGKRAGKLGLLASAETKGVLRVFGSTHGMAAMTIPIAIIAGSRYAEKVLLEDKTDYNMDTPDMRIFFVNLDDEFGLPISKTLTYNTIKRILSEAAQSVQEKKESPLTPLM